MKALKTIIVIYIFALILQNPAVGSVFKGVYLISFIIGISGSTILVFLKMGGSFKKIAWGTFLFLFVSVYIWPIWLPIWWIAKKKHKDIAEDES